MFSHRSLCSLPFQRIFEGGLTHPHRPAIIDPNGHTFHYSQLMRDVVQLCDKLQDRHKFQKGDRLAIWMPKGYGFVVTFLAIWACGGIAVPIFPQHPMAEIMYTLADCQASVLLTNASFQDEAKELGKCHPHLDIHILSPFKPVKVIPESYQRHTINPNDGGLIIYTSGTTGKPKGVLMTYANVEAQIHSLVKAWKWSKEDKILHVLPLHHTHGLVNCLLCPLTVGAACEFSDPFNAQTVWNRWMDPRKDLSLFMAVPTVYAKLQSSYQIMSLEEQQRAQEACSQFRLMVSGSSALPDSLFESWRRISGHALLERYGMTEIGMALGNPLHGDRIRGTVGFPFPGVEARIVNDAGQDVTELGESGELQIRGSQVFKEYWNRPKETVESFTQGYPPWFKTGDIAIKQQPRKNYKILGRASVDIIKSGGYKISALEIEKELLEFSKIRDVAVMGIPSREWGESISVLATLQENATLNLEELVDWLRPRIASYKLPRKLLILQDLPRNALGKVNKKQLVKLFEKDQ